MIKFPNKDKKQEQESTVTHRTGELIIRQGGEPKMAYVIKKGSVRVWKKNGGKEVEIARLGPGQIVGEMALIKGYPHSANVTALEETTLYAYSTKTINTLLAHTDPLMHRIISALVERLYHETFIRK